MATWILLDIGWNAVLEFMKLQFIFYGERTPESVIAVVRLGDVIANHFNIAVLGPNVRETSHKAEAIKTLVAEISEEESYLAPKGIEAEVTVARRCLDLAYYRTHEELRQFGRRMWRILQRHPTTVGIRTEGRRIFTQL